MFDPTGYTLATGTSFSGPHVAGVAALLKQAHPDWTPDMIRTAMINTATNMRSADGHAARATARSPTPSSIRAAVWLTSKAAVNTKALMGVAGDGIDVPGILGSHSFGEAAVLNNRIANTREVNVTIRDLSGQGGTYNLSTANNRVLDQPGFSASVSPSSVTVPAGGEATFKATVTIDGNVARDTATKQLQWYVIAQRAGLERTPPHADVPEGHAEPAGERHLGHRDRDLHAARCWPATRASSATTTSTSRAGTTYVDIRSRLTRRRLKLEGTLTWDYTDVPEAGVGLPDLDFLLFDPNGNQIDDSGNSSGPEHVSADTGVPRHVHLPRLRLGQRADRFHRREYEAQGRRGADRPGFRRPTSRSAASGTTLTATSRSAGRRRASVEAYEIEESTDGTNWTVARTSRAS